jgi:hypothetical protein
MAAIVRARILCMSEVLSNLGGEALLVASRTQVAALAESPIGSLSVVDLGMMSVEICKSNVHPDVLVSALQLFTPKTTPAASTRRAMQNFSTIADFFTADEWSVLDSEGSSQAKVNTICSRAIKLGLRCPSEPTLKLMSSLLVLVVHGAQPDGEVDLKGKLDAFKKTWKMLSVGEGHPPEYVSTLPASPSDLLRMHQATYQRAYADAAPVRCPLSDDELQRLNNCYRCRGGAAKPYAAMGAMALSTTSRSASSESGIMSVMMQGFQMMQKSQMEMFNQMMGSSGRADNASPSNVKLTFAERSKKPEHVHIPDIGAGGAVQTAPNVGATSTPAAIEDRRAAPAGGGSMPGTVVASADAREPPVEQSVDDIMLKFSQRSKKYDLIEGTGALLNQFVMR